MTDTLPFSQEIRSSIHEVHERAHGSAFMSALFAGALGRREYAALLGQYAHVYGALEDLGDGLREDPVAGPFVDDDLCRRAPIAADLRFYGLTDPAPLPATAAYVARLRAVEGWAGGFVAHHYTRYLGDLAGGQAVRVLLERRHGIVGPGAAFYDFSAVGPAPLYRRRYRGLLDDAPWDASERARVVSEVHRGFELTITLLDELADAVGLPAAAAG